MGAVCCCFHVEDFEDYQDPNSSDNRNCMCPRCLIRNCLNGYMALFHRGEVNAISSSVQGETSLTSMSTPESSLCDMYRSPPRPLPYDADRTCFHLQSEGQVSRREKGSSHLHEESEPLRRCDIDVAQDSLSVGGKEKGSDKRRSKGCFSESLVVKLPLVEMKSAVPYFYSSSENEDVCPTCLEEYTEENPKIMTKCSHHYHLGCIYEWQERSETCPVCGKVMQFDEAT